MKAVHVQNFGDKLALSTIPKPAVKANHVLVKTKYAPINPSDIYYSLGQYGFDKSLPRTVGFDGSGVVVEAGEDQYSQSLLGKSVAYIGNGTWAEYILVESTSLIAYGENLSEEQYQTISSSFVNPFSALAFLYGTQQRGETCLVQSAARSALGVILIKAAKKKGVKTINIVRKEEQVKEILELGGDYAINSSDPNFEEKLSEIIAKEKPMSFYDAVGGEFLSQVLNLMPDGSTTYSYGLLSLKPISKLDPSQFIFKNKAVKGFWLSTFMKENSPETVKSLIGEIASNIYDYCSSNISKVFEAADVLEAIEFYQANMSQGKVLLKF